MAAHTGENKQRSCQRLPEIPGEFALRQDSNQ